MSCTAGHCEGGVRQTSFRLMSSRCRRSFQKANNEWLFLCLLSCVKWLTMVRSIGTRLQLISNCHSRMRGLLWRLQSCNHIAPNVRSAAVCSVRARTEHNATRSAAASDVAFAHRDALKMMQVNDDLFGHECGVNRGKEQAGRSMQRDVVEQ